MPENEITNIACLEKSLPSQNFPAIQYILFIDIMHGNVHIIQVLTNRMLHMAAVGRAKRASLFVMQKCVGRVHGYLGKQAFDCRCLQIVTSEWYSVYRVQYVLHMGHHTILLCTCTCMCICRWTWWAWWFHSKGAWQRRLWFRER